MTMRQKVSRHSLYRKGLGGIGLAVLLTLALPVPVAAQQKRPVDECVAAASSSWTRQEAWVWNQLCSRRDADLNKSGRFGAVTDVNKPDSWSGQRVLRPSFIEAILGQDRYSQRLANRRIVISGAWFNRPIDLESASIPFALYIWQSRFDARVNLRGASISGNLGFDGSTFKDALDLGSTKIDGSVFLRSRATFRNVVLLGAEISGDVSTVDATFNNELVLAGVKVEGYLYLRHGATFQHVNLIGADIGADVEAMDSTFRRNISFSSAQVQGSVRLSGSKFAGYVSLAGSTVEGVLELYRKDHTPSWEDAAVLDLRGTTVGGIDDAPKTWPRHLRLAGFTIEQAHGQGAASDLGFTGRNLSWYLDDWLGLDKEYSRESFTQLEGILRSVGRNRIADRIAMARIDREYQLDKSLFGRLRQVVGMLYKSTVGFGYRPEWAIIPIAVLIAIGTWIARRLPQEHLDDQQVCSRLVLSTQRLIPLISFGKGYDDVDVTSKDVPRLVRRYFYVHAMLGYVLAAFLVTAIARITTT
jgi:uncharacterized protein YjbI with pentapeptide repeats